MPRNENVREAALKALVQVEQGAFVNLELQSWLRECSHWPAVDRGLFTELLYGTVRWQLYLDHFLSRWSSQTLDHLEKPVLCAMRMGLYQIRFLDQIPSHAAVAATGEALKTVLPRAVGYVNAVLRKACNEMEWKIRAPERSTAWLAINYSHPQWLVERWLKRWGTGAAEEMLARNNQPPLLWLRSNGLRLSPEEMERYFDERGLQAVRMPGLPEAFGLKAVPLSAVQEDLTNGLLSVQDVGAMLMAHGLNPQPGETILDLCAAPGGKSCHLAELMHNVGRIVAADVHPSRVELIAQQAKRLGVTIIEPLCRDARLPWGQECFDKILLDAPCSGTGVLRRKVDARWRKSAEQLPEMQKLQRELLKAACEALRPGGTLLYSTCSLEAEENEANLRWLTTQYPQMKLSPFATHPVFNGVEGAEHGLITLPSAFGDSDGFFMAKLISDRIPE